MKGSDWFLTKMKNKKKQQEQDTKPMLTHQHLHLFFQIFYPRIIPLIYPWKYLKITAPKPSWSTLVKTSQRNQEMMRFDDVLSEINQEQD